MPKIDAPSVAEHRERLQRRLVDAAEELLRDGQPLTAGAVSQAAGIARNSIYRYVDSVDDLRALVAERHLPEWMDSIAAATRGTAPADAVVAWVQVNLDEAIRTGHHWFFAGAATRPRRSDDVEAARIAHDAVRGPLVDAWVALLGVDPSTREGETRVRMAVFLTVGLLDAAFARLDGAIPAETVRDMTVAAARGVVDALAAGE